ncbi:MAG TPA: TolC family outer membrane protein [Caulobacterales bacterium]|nr:TolC family outer membrane protein [Caulobacterales bacterium]
MRNVEFFLAAAALFGTASAAQAETLADALNAAYLHNPTLEASRAGARATDEQYPQARARLLPQVSATATYGERRVDTNVYSQLPGDILTSKPGTYGLQATQTIFAGGRNIGAINQASANIDAAQESLRSTEQTVLLSTISAYMDVRRDAEILAIRANNVELLVKQVEEAQARFDVGEITRTDVAQAQARLAGARANLAFARANLEGSRARYAEIVGNPPGQLEAPPVAADVPSSLEMAIEQGLASNPDYLQQQHLVKAARAQMMIDRAGLLPQVSVTGQITRSYDDHRPFNGLALQDQQDARAVATLTIPLYQGGLARSRVAQSRDNLQRALAQGEATRRKVTSTVTSAWNDLDAARQAIVSTREQVEANQLAFDGAEQERDVGLRTTIEVLNAQQELLDSRVAQAQAERNAYVAAHGLLQAVGALDPKTLGVNAPLYDPDKHRKAVGWRF